MKSHRSVAVGATVTPEMVVRIRARELRTYTRTSQFDRVAAQHQFSDSASFDRFVIALLNLGIDYDGLCQAEAAQAVELAGGKLAVLAAKGPRLRLFSAATMVSFTICRSDGRLVWHDVFKNPAAIGTGAIAAEAAARQAIWLAALAREQAGEPAATLRLVMAQSYEITTRRLRHAARTAGLVLELTTSGRRNPAAEQRARRDAVYWSAADLRSLFDTDEESA
ncbi:hypothetical protein [Nocardia suismassiliense]|uniref:hypothetical protein n=1 Tax=Nocardia suismassiliense TaxID=2077092 RepID=UPI000D1F0B4E|nr:hypothetical protein [Nocardia suismassiliense]